MGVLVTSVEESFHPAVTDLAAWRQPTPLSLLAERGIQAVGRDREDPLSRLARAELTALANISELGDPQIAFVHHLPNQTQQLAFLRVSVFAA